MSEFNGRENIHAGTLTNPTKNYLASKLLLFLSVTAAIGFGGKAHGKKRSQLAIQLCYCCNQQVWSVHSNLFMGGSRVQPPLFRGSQQEKPNFSIIVLIKNLIRCPWICLERMDMEGTPRISGADFFRLASAHRPCSPGKAAPSTSCHSPSTLAPPSASAGKGRSPEKPVTWTLKLPMSG